MSIYLKDIPLGKAQELFNNVLASCGLKEVLDCETIKLDEACVGRTLASPVWAKISTPHYYAAAMDGFAVDAAITSNCSTSSPKIIKVLKRDQIENEVTIARYVDTGDPMPTWANAVIPIELTEPLTGEGALGGDFRNPKFVQIREPITPWQNVRSLGEDILEGEMVLPPGQVIRPVDLGVIAASGYASVEVIRKPVVGIIPTGSEVIPIGNNLKPGEIIEFNSLILAGQIISWGGAANRYSIVPDVKSELIKAISYVAHNSDIVLVIAGSSAGSEDYTADVISQLGKVFVHGIAVRPGHPVILGIIENVLNNESVKKPLARPVPIIGIPGYPVSATMTCDLFVKPVLSGWLGVRKEKVEIVTALLTKKLTSPPGDDDYVRVNLGIVDKNMVASPLSRGAGVISSMAKADGILVIPSGVQGLSAGVQVDIQLLRNMHELETSIFIIGSHDLCIDLLTLYLLKYDRRAVSSNVGSLSGLIALKQGVTHMAGSHLLDGVSGEYNIKFIRKYLPNQVIKVVRFVNRIQGLMVKRGNPKKINSLDDLVNPDITFINRQRGSGTRILLDYHLDKNKLESNRIKGYIREEYSHLAVAAAINSGKVDCGLGIAAAASIMHLDFIPLFEEKYDLIIPEHFLNSNLLNPLFRILHDEEFKSDILSRPGYTVTNMGEIITVG